MSLFPRISSHELSEAAAAATLSIVPPEDSSDTLFSIGFDEVTSTINGSEKRIRYASFAGSLVLKQLQRSNPANTPQTIEVIDPMISMAISMREERLKILKKLVDLEEPTTKLADFYVNYPAVEEDLITSIGSLPKPNIQDHPDKVFEISLLKQLGVESEVMENGTTSMRLPGLVTVS